MSRRLKGAIPIPLLMTRACRMHLFIAISCPPVFTHSGVTALPFCYIRNPPENLFSMHVSGFYFSSCFQKQIGDCLRRGEWVNLTKLTLASHSSLILKDFPRCAASVVKTSLVIYTAAAKRVIYGCEWAASLTSSWRRRVPRRVAVAARGCCPSAGRPGLCSLQGCASWQLAHCCRRLTFR